MYFELNKKKENDFFKSHFIKAFQGNNGIAFTCQKKVQRFGLLGKIWKWIITPEGRINRVRDAMILSANESLQKMNSVSNSNTDLSDLQYLGDRIKNLQNIHENLQSFNDKIIKSHNKKWTAKFLFWNHIKEFSLVSPDTMGSLSKEIQNTTLRLVQHEAKSDKNTLSTIALIDNLIRIKDVLEASNVRDFQVDKELKNRLSVQQNEFEDELTNRVQNDIDNLKLHFADGSWGEDDDLVFQSLKTVCSSYKPVINQSLKSIYFEFEKLEKSIQGKQKGLIESIQKLEKYIFTNNCSKWSLNAFFNGQDLQNPDDLVDQSVFTCNFVNKELNKQLKQLLENAKRVFDIFNQGKALSSLLLKFDQTFDIEISNKFFADFKKFCENAPKIKDKPIDFSYAICIFEARLKICSNVRAWINKAACLHPYVGLQILDSVYREGLTLELNIKYDKEYAKVTNCLIPFIKDVSNQIEYRKEEIKSWKLKLEMINKQFLNWVNTPVLDVNDFYNFQKEIDKFDAMSNLYNQTNDFKSLEPIRREAKETLKIWDRGINLLFQINESLCMFTQPTIDLATLSEWIEGIKSTIDTLLNDENVFLRTAFIGYFQDPKQSEISAFLDKTYELRKELYTIKITYNPDRFSLSNFLSMAEIENAAKHLKIPNKRFLPVFLYFKEETSILYANALKAVEGCNINQELQDLSYFEQQLIFDALKDPRVPRNFYEAIEKLIHVKYQESFQNFTAKCGQKWEGSTHTPEFSVSEIKAIKDISQNPKVHSELKEIFDILDLMIQFKFHPKDVCCITLEEFRVLIKEKKKLAMVEIQGNSMEYFDSEGINKWINTKYESSTTPLVNWITPKNQKAVGPLQELPKELSKLTEKYSRFESFSFCKFIYSKSVQNIFESCHKL